MECCKSVLSCLISGVGRCTENNKVNIAQNGEVDGVDGNVSVYLLKKQDYEEIMSNDDDHVDEGRKVNKPKTLLAIVCGSLLEMF